MRRYDDTVEVRRGQVPGTGGDPVEGPEQFLWRDRLWKVHTVIAQWVETGSWWQSSSADAARGSEEPVEGSTDRIGDRAGGSVRARVQTLDLCIERDVWRVEAGRGPGSGRGVFDLVFDWADGTWRLTRCLD